MIINKWFHRSAIPPPLIQLKHLFGPTTSAYTMDGHPPAYGRHSERAKRLVSRNDHSVVSTRRGRQVALALEPLPHPR